MRLIDGAASRQMDKDAMEIYGLDTLVLMENAGLRSADYAASLIGCKTKNSRVVIGE